MELREGWWYPEADRGLFGHRHTVKTLKEEVYPLLPSYRTAVQAGGAVGEWAMDMARWFERVITFEPNPELFACLQKNTAGVPQIDAYYAALGHENQQVAVGNPEKEWNFGSYYVGGAKPDENSAFMYKLDDFQLDDVDLIFLDVEGFELFALKGAEKTIQMWHPAVVVEWHEDQFKRYGYFRKDLDDFMFGQMGYRTRKPIRNGLDQIYQW